MAWLCLCEQEHTLNCLISRYILNQSPTTGVMLSETRYCYLAPIATFVKQIAWHPT